MSSLLPCPFCGGSHPAEVRICPVTKKAVERGASGLPKLRPFAMQTLDDPETRVGPPKPPSIAPAKSSGPAGMVGDIIGMKYKLLAVLGVGGMGAVYDAEHIQLGRPVAIKVLVRNGSAPDAETAEKRFLKEARSAGALEHPNICQVFDFGTLPNGSPFLVMEKLVGETLGQRLARERKLPIPVALEVIRQVLAGLGAAHAQNILHRDVKPENVFLARSPSQPFVAKLLDFGIAKNMASHGGSLDTLTQHGMVMGTPHYMSPEQARGRRDLDARVDLYACGVMLYEMLAGVRPFEGKLANEILLQIVRNAPVSVRDLRPEVSAALEQIIFRAMRKERNDRYATAAEFLADLGALPSAERTEGDGGGGKVGIASPYETRGEAPTQAFQARKDSGNLDLMRTIEDSRNPAEDDE